MSRGDLLAWERRWAAPTAVATFAALGFLVASIVVALPLGGGGEAESLRDLHEHSSTVTVVSVLQGVGFLLLLLPLVYIFRAAAGRTERVRAQFLPLVIAAPLALSVASALNGVAANQAATTFVNGESTTNLSTKEATKDCRAERRDDAEGFGDEYGKGDAAIADCAAEAIADDKAENAIDDTSLRGAAEGVQFGGLLALAFGLAYSCLFAMRVGLLTRFWGSLGMAIGVASVFGLFQLGVIWFFYFGLLLAGWVPGGKPPAWDAGEAIPWPTPGEKAAAELGGDSEERSEEDETEPRR